MAVYHHALVLINSSQDGVPLLQHAARMAEENGMRITALAGDRLSAWKFMH